MKKCRQFKTPDHLKTKRKQDHSWSWSSHSWAWSAKFIPNLATIGISILDLSRKHVKFVWGNEQQSAFERSKSLISQADTLAYFRNDCITRVAADAFPVGLSAVLTQLLDGLWRVISYASRSLSDIERRHSRTEKEALGLNWNSERFSLYVFGKKFGHETDHKPLKIRLF